MPGQRFGRLIALEEAAERTPSKNIQWDCRCDCGVLIRTTASDLRRGASQSCGCLRRDRTVEATATHRLSHKMTEYNIWQNMRRRCTNPNNPSYANYGGRGITICPEWDSFEQFLADMGPRPSLNHSIDRIDNERGYSPENCRWATVFEQAHNRRNNLSLTHEGRTQTLVEWATEYNIDRMTLKHRLERGWSLGRALTEPALDLRRHAGPPD